jgi:hypothetical protein
MAIAFSRWWFVLNHRVVIWFPKTTRECFMSGFRWRGNFIGVVTRGEEIDPRQEVYYERVRQIAEVLDRKDNGQLTLRTSGPRQKSADVTRLGASERHEVE